MIQKFVDRFMAKKPELEAKFREGHVCDYGEIVKRVIEAITGDTYDDIDPSRIHEINDGDYQGTLLYVIGCKGYQPGDYWYLFVDYGSCSGCDTLMSINDNGYGEKPTEKQVAEYMTLALHIVQGLKKLDR